MVAFCLHLNEIFSTVLIYNVFWLLHYTLFSLSITFSWKTVWVSILRNGFQEQLSITATCNINDGKMWQLRGSVKHMHMSSNHHTKMHGYLKTINPQLLTPVPSHSELICTESLHLKCHPIFLNMSCLNNAFTSTTKKSHWDKSLTHTFQNSLPLCGNSLPYYLIISICQHDLSKHSAGGFWIVVHARFFFSQVIAKQWEMLSRTSCTFTAHGLCKHLNGIPCKDTWSNTQVEVHLCTTRGI